MSGTTINYGIVKLDGLHSVGHRHEMVYDASRTNKIYDRFTFTVDTLVYGNNFAASIGITYPLGSTPGDVLNQAKYLLNQPRLPFKITGPDGTVLLETSGVDVDNGPQPRFVDVTQLAPATFRIRWTVEVSVVLCPYVTTDLFSGTTGVVAASAAVLLTHSWTHEESSDEKGNRRRVWNGTLRTISQDFPPARLKYLVTPALARGYTRESKRFYQSENGLDGSYQIVDRIVDYAAPYPTTSFRLRHAVSSSYEGTGAYLVDLHCTATGLAGAKRDVLIGTALQLMMTRVGDVQADGTIKDSGGTRAVLLRTHIENNFSSEQLPLVGCSMQFQLTPPEEAKKIGLDTLRLGKPIQLQNYDPLTSHGMGTAAFDKNTPVGGWLMYVKSACGGPKGHITTYTPFTPEGTDPGVDQNSQLQPNQEERPEPEGSAQWGTLPEIPNDPVQLKTSQVQLDATLYASYFITTTLQRDEGVAIFPIQKQASSYTGDTIVVMEQHEPTTIRVVEVRGERYNAPVEIPKPHAQDGEVLIDYEPHYEAPQLTAGGLSMLHRGGGTYRFAVKKRLQDTDQLAFGVPPWMKREATTLAYQFDSFQNEQILAKT